MCLNAGGVPDQPEGKRCSSTETHKRKRAPRHREALRLLNNLVEAAGVEPASENRGSRVTTCLAFALVSSWPAAKAGTAEDQPLSFRQSRRDTRLRLAHFMALVQPA